MITTDQIKELRDKTGVSVMQCKKALEEAGGDMDKAIVILRKVSQEIASKKADRAFGAGVVASYVHSSGTTGALLELVSETDFVANNDEFKALARDLAMHVVASRPEFLNASEITDAAKQTATEVFAKETEGKPEEMKGQILEGKLKAYFSEKVLLEQPFIKNPDLSVQAMIDSAIQKFGEKIEVARFTRFSVLEK